MCQAVNATSALFGSPGALKQLKSKTGLSTQFSFCGSKSVIIHTFAGNFFNVIHTFYLYTQCHMCSVGTRFAARYATHCMQYSAVCVNMYVRILCEHSTGMCRMCPVCAVDSYLFYFVLCTVLESELEQLLADAPTFETPLRDVDEDLTVVAVLNRAGILESKG